MHWYLRDTKSRCYLCYRNPTEGGDMLWVAKPKAPQDVLRWHGTNGMRYASRKRRDLIQTRFFPEGTTDGTTIKIFRCQVTREARRAGNTAPAPTNEIPQPEPGNRDPAIPGAIWNTFTIPHLNVNIGELRLLDETTPVEATRDEEPQRIRTWPIAEDVGINNVAVVNVRYPDHTDAPETPHIFTLAEAIAERDRLRNALGRATNTTERNRLGDRLDIIENAVEELTHAAVGRRLRHMEANNPPPTVAEEIAREIDVEIASNETAQAIPPHTPVPMITNEIFTNEALNTLREPVMTGQPTNQEVDQALGRLIELVDPTPRNR